jgi:transposase
MDQVAQIAAAHPDKRIQVWCEDEMRFGQQGTVARKWPPTGSRPPAIKQTKYDWLYVIGAVCPGTGQSVGMIAPHIDAKIVSIFLQEMARQIDPDVHVVLVWDQAGFHSPSAVRLPQNITLMPLPPYSPELNPTENLWHYLRSHYWSNREYEDWDTLSDAVCSAWQETCLNPQQIRTICNAPYLTEREVRV